MKPKYQQNMQRLLEYMADTAITVASAKCLLKRFEAPKRVGQSFRPAYDDFDDLGKTA